MSFVTTYSQHERKVYFYKLNENYKGTSPTVQIGGTVFGKDWKGFEESQFEKVKKLIRNKNNPAGTIEEMIRDGKTNKMYQNTEDDFKEKEKQFYTLEQLSIFTRDKLEHIAKEWELPTVNIINKLLIQRIISVQDDYKIELDFTNKNKIKKPAKEIKKIEEVQIEVN